ncbi:ABC transporter permease [Rhodococcus sp. 06-621-2]|nr:ABC transporter permease [Rhodococcus sp. 06-621-2]OZC55522.1 ABC transporter permease [Rhodococcus sp. 06-621-2]
MTVDAVAVAGTVDRALGGPSSRRARSKWFVEKLLSAIVVLWAAASLTFLLQVLTPGDRATLLLNITTGQNRQYTASELAPVEAEFGFDQPVFVQYLDYLRGLMVGDLGVSYVQRQPVLDLLTAQIVPTVMLAVSALVIAWLLSLLVILFTAGKGRKRSAVGSGFETIAAGLPHYWLGVILLVVFAVNLRWFPVVGGDTIVGMVLPAITLAVPLAGFLGQVTRDEFVRTLEQPFVTSARTRGASDLLVRVRHVLRHSILPAISLSGWAIGGLLSGAVIVETVFAKPGLGQLLVQGATGRDVPLVGGIVLVIAAVFVIANLFVDLIYSFIDPRMTK